jgi:hypothetical protein
MPRRPLAALAVALALTTSAACYHAVVETGRPAGTTVVQKSWVNTFVFGLVPASDIDVSAQCPGGVARVETQQTFLNGLVGAITLGIYTPQSATITCAAGRTGALDARFDTRGHTTIGVADGATAADRVSALRSAADESARTGQPVFVRF